jgi:alpha-tubulin suppressor-like RCC1 family protein
VVVAGLSGVAQLAAGGSHTCARLATGAVQCWGANSYGQIGDGTTTNRTTPVAVVGLSDAIYLALGQSHSCAIRATGDVVCWGRNDRGQLGNGTATTALVPSLVLHP